MINKPNDKYRHTYASSLDRVSRTLFISTVKLTHQGQTKNKFFACLGHCYGLLYNSLANVPYVMLLSK